MKAEPDQQAAQQDDNVRDTQWAEQDEGFETEFRVRQKLEIDRRLLRDFFFVIQIIRNIRYPSYSTTQQHVE